MMPLPPAPVGRQTVKPRGPLAQQLEQRTHNPIWRNFSFSRPLTLPDWYQLSPSCIQL
jgi:hypothetical protein